MTITEQLLADTRHITEEQLTRQFELEERMCAMGVDRYWSSVNKTMEKDTETNTRPVRRLMNTSIDLVTKGIEAFIVHAKTGGPGRRHTALKFMEQLESEALALITCRVVLDRLTKGDKLVSAALKVGSMVEDEVNFRRLKAANPGYLKYLVRRCKELNYGSYERNAGSTLHMMDVHGYERVDWSVADRTFLGTKLIEIMSEMTGLITLVTRHVDPKREAVFIEPTPATVEWVQESHNRCEALSPTLLPTIIPPRPWVSPTVGGYWSGRIRQNLVKTFNKTYLKELAEHDMPDVYDAVNAMQSTAWRINTQVLDVARTLWENKSRLGVIPQAEDAELPLKPPFLDREDYPKEKWTEEEQLTFKEWKRVCTDIHAYNARSRSTRLQFLKIMHVAELFEEEDAIYFPHQLDFRGRCYAMPLFLNPQGSDLSRGLIEFGNAVAITDEGSRSWLAIHGSNCFGYDKVSLADRVKWVEEHQEEILAVAADPFSNKLWVDADKPWQFLAFCFDWAGFVAEGYGYLSCLPIQMDGSCNGLQNFSAALRDAVGGAAVNLVPGELPNDIYQQVADRVLLRVREDAANADDETMALAQGWLKVGINRKVCKRPVMTLAYGAKRFGFSTQVFEDTVLPYRFTGNEWPWADGGWKAASYLGGVIWDEVGNVVVAARHAMDWLQHIAKAATKEDLPVRWETPDGFVVFQAYHKLNTKTVSVTFMQHRHVITVATGAKKELDKSRQSNGIAPNWVHSMDASHMRETLRRAWGEGIRSFSLIHDSYGTHAGNTQVLAEVLREAFIGMYSGDVLADFQRELMNQLPEDVEIPPVPPKGTLDLELVKRSEYFFA